MKLKLMALAVLFCALLAGLPLRAQIEGTTSAPASQSTASGQRAEPTAALNDPQPTERDAAADLKEPSAVVKKLGGMLGMSPTAARDAFNWLNFAVLAGAILFGVAKALPKAFRNRTAGIQKNIVEARSATELANARLSAVEARLSKLDDEIASIRAESEQESAEEEARTRHQIAEETDRILKSAEQEIAAASAQAQRNLRAYAAGVAVDRAASHLQISDDDNRALIQNFAAKLGEGSRN